MKRFIAFGSAIAAAALIISAAVAVARPEWLPAGIRARVSVAADADHSGHDHAGGHPTDTDAGEFCDEHGVPEKFCTLCDPKRASTLALCSEHGNIPEAICTKCNPAAEKKYGLHLCHDGHGYPESFCVDCGKAPSTGAAEDGWCAVHNSPEELCAECRRDPASHQGQASQPLPTVRLASPKLARQVGIETAEVTEESHAHTLTANAETAYDANRYADITPRVIGFLREVRADLGKVVKQGEVLAVVDSAEVSAAKAQYITAQSAVNLAQVTYDRTTSLTRSGAVAAKAELEALTALNQAKAASLDAEQRLRNFGFDDAQLARVVRENDTKSLLNVVSPLDGVVVVRHAVQGEPVQTTTQIFAVADTSRMWLWIDVYESDIAAVKPGQDVAFSVSGGDTPAVTGAVNWVGTEVNQQTRTTRVRAELANPGGQLRANQFGQAEIQVDDEHQAVIVPKAAVQRKDDADVVFLPEEVEGVYRPRRIVTRPTNRGDVLEVAWGLEPGQRVVTRGAFLLKTEIMKDAIGAGCAH